MRYAEEGARERASEDVARVYDDVLDVCVLWFFGDVFVRCGVLMFWIEYDYYVLEIGFFLYVYDVSSRRENKMDVVVDMVKDVVLCVFLGVKCVRYVEWWVYLCLYIDGY